MKNNLEINEIGLKELVKPIKLEDFISFGNKKLSLSKNIDNESGVYVFWWIGNVNELKKLNRELIITGKNLKNDKKYIKINWNWNLENEKVCLYVGKTTTILNRLKQHLYNYIEYFEWYDNNWLNKIKEIKKNNPKIEVNKLKQMLYKRNTSCQFRAGIEHLFKVEKEKDRNINIIQKIKQNIGFSYYLVNDKNNGVAKRFFLEDLAIAIFKPWFNVDSER